jgi:hypothetical protein
MERLVISSGGDKGPSSFLPDSVQVDWLKLVGLLTVEEEQATKGHDVLLEMLDDRRKRLEAGDEVERDHDEGDRV